MIGRWLRRKLGLPPGVPCAMGQLGLVWLAGMLAYGGLVEDRPVRLWIGSGLASIVILWRLAGLGKGGDE